ncbi:MAG: hypothetical protein M3146_07455 [Thermoproteota archaeon]|nr:hypothetical protein [Thermoproteota archaeon]
MRKFTDSINRVALEGGREQSFVQQIPKISSTQYSSTIIARNGSGGI